MVKYKDLNINITSSNAENVNISFDDSNNLVLTFIDYAKKNVKVKFKDVKAFCYKKAIENNDHKNDQIFEVVKSEWMQEQLADYSEEQLKEYAHFMFCFNKYEKTFHVICNLNFDFKAE